MVGLPGGPRSGLLANAVRRGLIGGSRAWQIVLAVAVVGRLVRRAGRSRPTVLRERLGVGETLEIRHLSVDTSASSPSSVGRPVVDASSGAD